MTTLTAAAVALGGRIPPRLPQTMAALPRDKHGRPIPWFVQQDDPATGTGHDFRIQRTLAVREAIEGSLCWICGTRREPRECAFLVGPMCAVNRTTPEPPSHRECARYAADACPFLSVPAMRRRTTGLPAERLVSGEMIPRNPGVACLWFTTSFTPFRVPARFGADRRGVLFQMGEPSRVTYRCEGRPATRAEVEASVEGGLPLLREACDRETEHRRADAHRQLDEQTRVAARFLPTK